MLERLGGRGGRVRGGVVNGMVMILFCLGKNTVSKGVLADVQRDLRLIVAPLGGL
jgi:hypothetical protein